MKQYMFEELTNAEKNHVRLKLAVKKYLVLNDMVKVWIDLEEEKEVVLRNTCKNEFFNVEFSKWEPIYIELERLFNNVNEDFLQILLQYKENAGKRGDSIKECVYVKLFHAKEPSMVERDECGRKWIDYNKQITSNGIIEDFNEGCGLWATNLSYLYSLINSSKRYGNSIMLLAPIDEVEYFICEKEIVGDKFQVIMSGTLDDKAVWRELFDRIGDSYIDDMPYEIREEYVAAHEIYEEYIKKVSQEQSEIYSYNENKFRIYINDLWRMVKDIFRH